MTRIGSCCIAVSLALLSAGCARESNAPPAAEPSAAAAEPLQLVVELQPLNDSGTGGTATFTEREGQVALRIELSGAPAGEHAVHLHEIGDCSAPDGSSAGGHWNPTDAPHGRWGHDGYHLGDVGNVVVGEDGTGSYELVSAVWSLGTGEPNDVLGKSIIVHAGVDDFVTQPTGGAGGRIACGVVR